MYNLLLKIVLIQNEFAFTYHKNNTIFLEQK
jgi:hypothetical protein